MKIKILLLNCFLILLCTVAFAQRKVLIEQFTNSGCPPCAANTPVIASYVNNHPNNVLMLSYHTSFPYLDSMYYENPGQSDQRVAFYGVPSVPHSVVDGNVYAGASAPLVSNLNNSISTRALVAPRYAIRFLENKINGNRLNVTLELESTDSGNTGENLVAHIVACEKTVLKSSYLASPGNNSENEYPWVVRKMLPDEHGNLLSVTSPGQKDTVQVNWTINNVKDLQEMRVVAFVQNTMSKEIYQAEVSTPSNVTGIHENASHHGDLFEYRNLASEKTIRIHLLDPKRNDRIRIVDILGNELVYRNLNEGQSEYEVSTISFSVGVYIIQVWNEEKTQSERLFISK